MFSKLMLSGANCLLLDQPTNHLDLESIQSLNNGLVRYSGSIIFSSHDHEFISTIANKIIEITPKGVLQKSISFDEYLADEHIQKQLEDMYK
jgi:ATPase subunit of ABC transporter with duplicated ATPase domains